MLRSKSGIAKNVNRTADLLLLHGGGEVLVLMRNVVLARSLGASEFGVLTMLAISLRLVEMFTDFAVDRLLVQSPRGATASFQASVHGFSIGRGVLSGGALALLAPLFAVFVGVPELGTVLAVAGLAPVIKGFSHYDAKLKQRQLDFRSAAWVESLSQVFAIAICFCALPFRSDVWIGVLAILAHATGQLLVSHLVASRKYYIQLDRRHLNEIFSFGWPLALNGLLMFAVLQGDKLVVAASATTEELAKFAVAAQLALLPALLVNRIANSALLPVLSKNRGQGNWFAILIVSQRSMTLVGMLLAICTIGCINPIIRILYGPEFVVSAALVAAISLCQLFRTARIVPTVAAVASGTSSLPLKMNLVRLLGFLLAIFFSANGGNLVWIAGAGAIGELLALMAAVYFFKGLLGNGSSIRGVITEQAFVGLLVSLCALCSLQPGGAQWFWLVVGPCVLLHAFLVTTSVWQVVKSQAERKPRRSISNSHQEAHACQ